MLSFLRQELDAIAVSAQGPSFLLYRVVHFPDPSSYDREPLRYVIHKCRWACFSFLLSMFTRQDHAKQSWSRLLNQVLTSYFFQSRPASKSGFLKSRRDRKKEKEKDKEKERDKKAALKKKRDSDASSVKSDGEPSLNASGGIIAGSGGSIGSGAGVGIGAAVASTSAVLDANSSGSGAERERQDKEDNLLSTIADPTLESGVRVDEEGYTIRPRDDNWNAEKTSGFYSSSDADSGNEPTVSSVDLRSHI